MSMRTPEQQHWSEDRIARELEADSRSAALSAGRPTGVRSPSVLRLHVALMRYAGRVRSGQMLGRGGSGEAVIGHPLRGWRDHLDHVDQDACRVGDEEVALPEGLVA